LTGTSYNLPIESFIIFHGRKQMNDIINDLNKLYELNAISFELRNSSFQEFQKIISPMIKEKEDIKNSFEKEIPLHIEELNNKLKGVA